MQGRLDAMVEDLRSAAAARSPDAYFSGIRERLEDGFRPTWRDLDSGGVLAGATIRSFLAAAERFGKSGHIDGDSTGAFRAEIVTVVRVTMDPNGRPLAFELLRPSGNAAHDRLALERCRSLVGAAFGAPPGAARAARWSFTTAVEVIPPVPVIGFGPNGIVHPLERLTRSTVRLVGVDAAPGQPRPAG